MTQIPTTIDDVTAEWLSQATDLSVRSLDHELIGVGVGVSSAVYRLRLTGDDAPASMIIKLNALDEAANFTSTMLRMYEREVKFFGQIAGRSPIRVPWGHGGAIAEDGRYYVLMEDMGANRVVDQNDGMELSDAENAIDELAQWHGEFWGDANQYVDTGAAVSLADPIYTAVLPMVFAEGWEKLRNETDVHPAIAAIAERWVDAMPDMLTRLSTSPTTVVHGDYRADNILFDADDKVVLLDFQLTGLATGAYDLAYFLTQSLLPDVAERNERALFERYREGLHQAGVSAADTDRLWDDYRVAALFCLVYPVVASRGMDLSDQRQRDLLDNMSVRFSRAIEGLDLAALL